MKCLTEKCKEEATYVFDGLDLCSDCVTTHAQTKPGYFAEAPNEK